MGLIRPRLLTPVASGLGEPREVAIRRNNIDLMSKGYGVKPPYSRAHKCGAQT